MKRCRISTLMLLVVIAALVLALIVQQDRYDRLVAELRKRPISPFFKYSKQQFRAPTVRTK
jgi:hypothetical protein